MPTKGGFPIFGNHKTRQPRLSGLSRSLGEVTLGTFELSEVGASHYSAGSTCGSARRSAPRAGRAGVSAR